MSLTAASQHGRRSAEATTYETVQEIGCEQDRAQLSARLTGFVNSTGYTVKDVVNKAAEVLLKRYGG